MKEGNVEEIKLWEEVLSLGQPNTVETSDEEEKMKNIKTRS
jgi:hypothetical protein